MNAVINQPAVQFDERRVLVNGAAVAARVSGQGTPIVLFHSLLADDSSFDPIATVLAQRHHVVIMALPGFGGSARVDGDLEQIADHMAAAITALGLGQAPILLGNGYGGFIALLTAMRHPGSASRLVLADCGAAFSEAGRAAFRGMSAKARENGLAGISDIAMRRLFSPAYQGAHPELIEARRARFLAVDIDTFHAACAALASLDVRAGLAQVTVPALVLCGEFDEATPPEMSRELAAGLPNATLQILPGCAHVPQLQEPAQFLAAIEAFIAD